MCFVFRARRDARELANGLVMDVGVGVWKMWWLCILCDVIFIVFMCCCMCGV